TASSSEGSSRVASALCGHHAPSRRSLLAGLVVMTNRSGCSAAGSTVFGRTVMVHDLTSPPDAARLNDFRSGVCGELLMRGKDRTLLTLPRSHRRRRRSAKDLERGRQAPSA